MGTSKDSPGPGSHSPLIPPWADPQADKPLPKPEAKRFRGFRRALGAFVRTGSEHYLRSALSAYVLSGLGGSATATRRHAFGAAAGANLLSWIGAVSDGETGARQGLDVSALAGLSSDVAIARIVDVFCPPAGAPEHDSIRNAMQAAISESLGDAGIDTETFTFGRAEAILEAFLAELVVARLILVSGGAFDYANDPVGAIAAENNLREFVRSVVEVKMRTVIADFSSSAGPEAIRAVIERLMSAVFESLEEL